MSEPLRSSGPSPGTAGNQDDPGKSSSLLRELPILILIALGLALLIKTFLVQAFFIPSDSMENTLRVGDRVLVNKLSMHFGEIKRGQIVVFQDPGGWLPENPVSSPTNPVAGALKDVLVFVGLLPSDSEKDLIKRVVGLPGDHVVCCDKQGRISVDNVPLTESYVFSGNPPSDKAFNITVPPDRFWVMGDHRALSADSRAHAGDPGGGTVPRENVIGRAVVIVWPLSRWQTLPVPDTFAQPALRAAAQQVLQPALQALGGLPLVLVFQRRSRGASQRARRSSEPTAPRRDRPS